MKIDESHIIETNDYRVIIYPASRQFTTKEVKEITESLYDFLSTWQAHGKPLSSSFKIEHKQFIVITVDEDVAVASGCSRDDLNGFMRKIDSEYELGLFDRMKATYLKDGEIITEKLSEFKAKVRSGEIADSVQVFDFSKDTYLTYLHGFLLPLKESWAGFIK